MKKLRVMVCLIDFLLVFGLLSFAGIFFYANLTMNPYEISMVGDIAERRLFFRILSEKMYTACGSLYTLGHIVMIGTLAKNGYRTSIRRIACYFLSQILLAALCVLPFAFLDRTFAYDYIFPLRGLSVTLLILFLVSSILYVLKNIDLP